MVKKVLNYHGKIEMIAAAYKEITPPSTDITFVTIKDVRRDQKRHHPPPETTKNVEDIYWNRQ